MMKFLSLLLLTTSTAAFTAPSFGVRLSTKAFTVPNDPDFLNKIAQDGDDAVRVVYQECDPQECTTGSAVKDDDGWHFKDGLEGDREVVSRKVLMWEKEDTE